MTQVSFRRPAVLTGAALVALALLLHPAPARAATIVYDATTLPAAATPNMLATSTSGTSVNLIENDSGDFGADGRSPWNAPNEPVVDHTAATSLFSALRNGTATYDFGGIFQHLSLVWGTPGGTPLRPGNILTLLLDGVTQFTLHGGTGPAAFSGNNEWSVLVTISDLRFDTMVLSAGNPAFEFANLSVQRPVPVPVPAAGLLLIGAMGALAMLRRRTAA